MKTIRIYRINTNRLETSDEYNKHFSNMPKYRQEKIERIRYDSGKRLSLGAGILLERALDDAGVNGDDRSVILGKNGKPQLERISDVQFSISHSGSMAILAISYDGTMLGIDIEQMGDADRVEKIAGRLLSDREKEYLAGISDTELRREWLYSLWTVKESYVKALGTGLGTDFRTVESDIDSMADGSVISVKSEENAATLFVKKIEIENDYSCALCTEYRDIEIVVTEL